MILTKRAQDVKLVKGLDIYDVAFPTKPIIEINKSNEKQYAGQIIRVFLEEALREVTRITFKIDFSDKCPTKPDEEIKDDVFPTNDLTTQKFISYMLFGVNYTETVLSRVFKRFEVFRMVLKNYGNYGGDKFHCESFIDNNDRPHLSIFNLRKDPEYNKLVKIYLKIFDYYKEIINKSDNSLIDIFINSINKIDELNKCCNFPNQYLFDLFDDKEYTIKNHELLETIMKSLLIYFELAERFIEYISIDPYGHTLPTDQYVLSFFKVKFIERVEFNKNNYNWSDLALIGDKKLYATYHFLSDGTKAIIKFHFNTDLLTDNLEGCYIKSIDRNKSIGLIEFEKPVKAIHPSIDSGFLIEFEDGYIVNERFQKPLDIEEFDVLSLHKVIDNVDYTLYAMKELGSANEYATQIYFQFKNDDFFKSSNQWEWATYLTQPINVEKMIYKVKENLIKDVDFVKDIWVNKELTKIIIQNRMDIFHICGDVNNDNQYKIIPAPLEMANDAFKSGKLRQIVVFKDNISLLNNNTFLNFNEIQYHFNKCFDLHGELIIGEYVDNYSEPTRYAYTVFKGEIKLEENDEEKTSLKQKIFEFDKGVKLLKISYDDQRILLLDSTGRLFFYGKDILSENIYSGQDIKEIKYPDIITSNHVEGLYDILSISDSVEDGDYNTIITSTGKICYKTNLGTIRTDKFKPLDAFNIMYQLFYDLYKNNPFDKIDKYINTNQQVVQTLKFILGNNIHKCILSKIIDSSPLSLSKFTDNMIDTTKFSSFRHLNNIYKYNEIINFVNITDSLGFIPSLSQFISYIGILCENHLAVLNNEPNPLTINFKLPKEYEDTLKKLTSDPKRKE
jgi:hypothetical protein